MATKGEEPSPNASRQTTFSQRGKGFSIAKDPEDQELSSEIHRQFRAAHEGHKPHAGLDASRASTGVVWTSERAYEHGFADHPEQWANLGQGAPEVDDDIEGSFKRPTSIPISTAGREYGPTAGIKPLREAVAKLYNEHHRKGKESKYTFENVCICPGGRSGLIRIAAVLGNAYLGFFIPDYTAYNEMMGLFRNFSTIPIPLSREDGYHIHPNKIADEIARGTSVILTSNPRNPTGQVCHGDELAQVQDICRDRATLIMDEFYCGYNYTTDCDGTVISAANNVQDVDKDDVLIIDGMTKRFRLPGWRVAWIVGPKEFIKAIGSCGSYLDGGTNVPFQEAAVAMLEPGRVLNEMKALQRHFRDKRDYVLGRLREIGFTIKDTPGSTFYLWLDLSCLPDGINDGLNFFAACLKEKVIVVPGIFFDLNPSRRRDLFDSPCHHYIRFSYGPKMDVLKKGLDGIERVVKKYKGQSVSRPAQAEEHSHGQGCDIVLSLSRSPNLEASEIQACIRRSISTTTSPIMAPKQDTLFRSADMSLVQLYMANEIGREVVSSLGELGIMDFRDLNAETNAFQRTFTQEIRRLDNVERQLRYFQAQCEKSKVTMRPMWEFVNNMSAPTASEIDELADRSQNLEQRIQSLNESYSTLKRREMELTEWRWVLREAGGFFDRARGQTEEIRQSIEDDDAPLLRDMEQAANGDASGERSFSVMNIGFVAGVIPREKLATFEKVLWRLLRGNLYMNQSEIPDPIVNPETNEETYKSVFVIFAHGKEIINKIRKISESLGADIYNVDENHELRRDQVQEVNTRLGDLSSVLANTSRTLQAELTQIGRSLTGWMVVIKKEKAVFQTLNRFSYDQQRKTLIAEAWCPTNSLPQVKATLSDVNERAGLSIPTIVNTIKTNRTPPTYVKTNKFTLAFQTIIDAYGTAKYQEVNQGLTAIVTFPFLFAVMFGDLGHGFIMFCAAIAMITYEKQLSRGKLDELFGMIFFGRYIVLLMGIYSMFTGAIYNDIFSKGIPLFNSMFVISGDFTKGHKVPLSLNKDGYVYPFGLDWRWHEADNELLFSNSFKMKLAIILGYCHMTYNLIFSYVNARHFKSKVDIFGNFIPGMIFFQSIFGYLVFAIIYKWATDWTKEGAGVAPNLLNMLIYMFLKPGTVDEPLFRGQGPLQVVLVLAALCCVPVMLLLKPLWLRHEHNKARGQGYRGIGENTRVSALDNDDDDDGNEHQGNGLLNGGRDSFAHSDDGAALITQDIGHGEHGEEFDYGEIQIEQTIHTIEFCLNCISHTASYLRLWALSLAHQQLSIVLWSMTLDNALTLQAGTAVRIIATFVFFAMWFFLSVAVLVVMEGTSAMLHSLRLHWVEAMSKHFVGEGVPFEPFSFERMLEDEMTELK